MERRAARARSRGAGQVLLLLPVYLAFIVVAGLHLRGDLLLPLAALIGMALGAIGGAAFVARFR